MTINLNWVEIWRQFDKWFDNPHAICQDDWAAQQRAIKRIVNKEIKEQEKLQTLCNLKG